MPADGEFCLASGHMNVTVLNRVLIWPPASPPINAWACYPAHQEVESVPPPCESGLAVD